MSDGPGGLGNRFANLCISLLVGAMALYGAVFILCAIWVPLIIAIAISVIVGGSAALIYRHFRRW
jgi:CBS domain containing-hemolysin-like protein